MVNLIESLNSILKEGLIYKRFSNIMNRFHTKILTKKCELKLESVHDKNNLYLVHENRLINASIDDYIPYLGETAYSFEIIFKEERNESFHYIKVVHTDGSLIKLKLDPSMRIELAYRILKCLLKPREQPSLVYCTYYDGKGSNVMGEQISIDLNNRK